MYFYPFYDIIKSKPIRTGILENHNVYTEVTRAQYVYMQIIQVVGISTFLIECILCIIFRNKNNKDESLEINLKTGSNNIED